MANLKRKLVGKSSTITVNLGNFSSIKVVGTGEWEVEGDGEVTLEQHQALECEVAVEAKRAFFATLVECGKGTEEAMKFFEECKNRKERRERKHDAKES